MLVIAVLDGDTIKTVDQQQEQYTVRLASIDAPEKNQPYGLESTEILKGLIGYKRVYLECPTKDRYERWICTVKLNDTDVNHKMVGEGGAWVYRRYYTGTSYIESEIQAKKLKRGLWSSTTPPIAPWEWRRR